MQDYPIDFKNYSTDELFEAFEGVDHLQYPERAITIYDLILQRMDLQYHQVTAEALGYADDSSQMNTIERILNTFLNLVTPSFYGIFDAERDLLHFEMQEKIHWLNAYLDEQKSLTYEVEYTSEMP